MGEQLAQPVVLDATILSNFASSGSIEWLLDVVRRPAVVRQVRAELERGIDHGHTFLAKAIEPVGDGLDLVGANRSELPADLAVSVIHDRLDPGEAESLLVAIELDGTLATDDLAARRLATETGVPVTGSVGLLALGVERGVLDVATANEWLETWRTERRYYAPVERLEAILEE